jgi:hypothetical protein
MNKREEHYHELAFYTLSHHNMLYYIHQHIVDAQAAQTADAETKPITILFSLVGLYLFVEKDFTGRQVQQFHMKMAKNKRPWPPIILPSNRGDINVSDVVIVPPGLERDKMIQSWCETVWKAYKDSRIAIVNLVKQYEN